MIICADAGGTNIRFAYLDDKHKVVIKKKYAISAFPGGEIGFPAALNKFLDETKDLNIPNNTINCIVVSASGYIKNDNVHFTNTDWIVSKGLILDNYSKLFTNLKVYILNDFEALAYGVATIENEDVVTIFSRQGTGDTKIVCGPGTGLGLAGLKEIGTSIDDLIVIPSEGGHQSFPVETSTEMKIKEYIMEDWVSYEHILSGQGLQMLYGYFSQITIAPNIVEQTPEEIIKQYNSGNVAAKKALEAFSYILGGFCGNMVLALGATNGVYLWGGILKEFPSELLRVNLVTRFKKRIKASSYPDVPIFRITSNEIALRGCSVYAVKHLKQ